MAAWRRAIELSLGEADTAKLRSIAQSRTEPASRVERARILLAYREDPSFFAVGRALGLHHQTVQRCVERAVAEGPLAALDDRPRPGREPTITPEAKAWLVSLACRKAKELGYPHELWTTRLLARHAREHGPAEGHACLANLAQGTVCKILDQEEVKPHKVRYYLEQRDPDFAEKMAEVLCVYRQVRILKQAAAVSKKKLSDAMAIISYDEKPGIQAIATTAPDLPPEPGVHATFAREHEYKRHGTISLLAGIDLVTGKVHALVKDRHRSREFIEFLKLLDAAYPAHTAIKLILDNHSAHISKETKAWLADQPAHRFEFTFTPKHGSWLNLVEGFFSKLARSVLRHIRVASKQELKDRIMAAMDYFNQEPVVHTWAYKLDKAAENDFELRKRWSSTRLSPLDCTVLICESFLVSIFKPELSLSHLLALAHLASQSGPAWHVICTGFDNPAGPPPPAQLQTPKRTHAIGAFRWTYLIAIPNAGSKFRPRLPRCENFTRPPWSDCGSTAAGSGGGRSRGQITRFSLEPLADVASAALAISWPSRREAIVSDVRSKRIVTGYPKQTTASRRAARRCRLAIPQAALSLSSRVPRRNRSTRVGTHSLARNSLARKSSPARSRGTADNNRAQPTHRRR